MPGLLDFGQRTCRYGHGPLELLMGTFALTGIGPMNALAAVAGAPASSRTRIPNGQLYAVKIWRCPDCGYVELFEEVPGKR